MQGIAIGYIGVCASQISTPFQCVGLCGNDDAATLVKIGGKVIP